MENDTLIRKIHMSCPLCGKTHEVEEKKRIATINLKGEAVTYEEDTRCQVQIKIL